MRSFTAILSTLLLAAALTACSLGAPLRAAATPLPSPTHSAGSATAQPAASTRPAPTATRPPLQASPTRPAPSATAAVAAALERRDLAVLSPANIAQAQLLAGFRPGPNGAVAPLLFTPDHTRLIFGLASADPQSSLPVYVWTLASGLPDSILQSGAPTQPVLALSADAALLAAASSNGVQLWATQDWQPLPIPAEALPPADVLAFSPDGRLLAGAADGTLRLWDPAGGVESWQIQAHQVGVSALAVSHAGAWAASAGLDGALRLWKTSTGEDERELSRIEGVTTLLAFLPDDQELLSYAKDGLLRFWRLSDGQQIAQLQVCSSGLPGCTPPAFSPDRRLMALSDPAAEGGPGIFIWDLQTHSLHARLDTAPLLDPARIAALAFSPDGRLLAVGSQDGQVQLWGVSGTPFTVGAQLRVTEEGDGLNLRDRPALAGSIRSQLHTAETLTLLEGPQVAGGFNWWRALTGDGREGWIVEVPEWYAAAEP